MTQTVTTTHVLSLKVAEERPGKWKALGDCQCQEWSYVSALYSRPTTAATAVSALFGSHVWRLR